LLATSTRLGTTPSTVAIAWTMAQPSITSAIASATSVAQLDELLRAAELRIDDASMAQLQAASAA
jgi:aryl-alcohol dehydrogenase-like predicted oxidoreductase